MGADQVKQGEEKFENTLYKMNDFLKYNIMLSKMRLKITVKKL